MSLPPTFNVPTPSQTASLASSYIPPFAGTATPLATSAVTSALNPNPSTPALQDDHQWITTYLDIHQMSSPSYRYTYIFWLAILFIFLVSCILHWTGSRGGAVGGLWSKWSLRRRTWRKQHSIAEARRHNKPHKQPLSLPSNAQLLTIVSLYILTILLCFLGPDYIAPRTHVWDLSHNLTSRKASANLHARAAPIPQTSTTSQPSYTIPKAWWTAGGRTGTIAFALFPLCILFALKAPPFALFALPFLIQIYNDKLAFIHRWSGRLIWLVTALHVAFWSVQLSHDKRGTDNPASVWNYAFLYNPFVYGWLAFICLTLLVALSARPVRVEFYEMFYVLHILLIVLTLFFSALHFPAIGWWCWATLVLWGAERLWRFVRFLRINGILGVTGNRKIAYAAAMSKMNTELNQNVAKPGLMSGHTREESHESHRTEAKLVSPTEFDTAGIGSPTSDAHTWSGHPRPFSIGQETIRSIQTGSSIELMSHAAGPESGSFPPWTPAHVESATQHLLRSSLRGVYIPPPGYAHAVLLPGRTVRLRLITARHFSWAPGQHILLNIPSVSKFTSHPFTIASICDDEAPSYEGREIVILSRARTGFTRRLWTHIEQLEANGKLGDTPSSTFVSTKRGVLLRAYVDGPFGSSARARWTSFSTILVIAGGSGVSFAISVLQYACMCMTGRNSRQLGGRPGIRGQNTLSQISRVRFVWIIREFSHIQWVASTIRRCMDMVPPSSLQVDIYVTNVAAKPRPALTLDVPPLYSGDSLAPPAPNFARTGRNRRNSNVSDISLESGISENTTADISYLRVPQPGADPEDEVVDIVDMYGELGHEEHVLDLTNFDGEDDSALPGESQLSYRLRKEGKLRRARTRLSQSVLQTKRDIGGHAAESHLSSQPPRGHYKSRQASPIFPPPTPSKEYVETPTSATPLRGQPFNDPLSPTSHLDSPLTPISLQSARPSSFLYSDFNKTSRDVSPVPSGKSEVANRHAHHVRTQSKFDMDEAEVEDTPVVAERARPGKAKIDRIIADEAGRSRGAMIVACCGPMSLNAVVRKSVAAHINPSRIMQGDMRANIALVSEEFEW